MALPPRFVNDSADRAQIELLRAAGTAKRFARARSLSASMIALARRAIRVRHPELSEREVLLRFVATHYGERLALGLRRRLEQRAP
jgi:hypothetical protein